MKTPEEIADEIVNVASEAAYGDCPKRHMDATDEHCPGCLRSMIAAAIREAEIRGVNAGIVAAAGILSAPHRCVSGSEFECCIDEKAVAIRDLDPAAISAERSAGLSDGGKDRKATGELSDAPKPAPACARCGGSGKVIVREWQTVGASGVYEWHVERTACPECRGKP